MLEISNLEFLDNFLEKYNWIGIPFKLEEINTSIENDRLDPISIINLRKEYSFLHFINCIYFEIIDLQNQFKKLKFDLENEIDSEMILLLKDELNNINEKIKEKIIEVELKIYIEDIEQERSAFVELRAGTGGLEASLFVADLSRMYTLYSQKQNWSVSIVDFMDTGVGGFKEIIMHIEGKGVFEKLQYESGVHRVQRVPDTESSGRVHTSTITVAVLPEADAVEVNIDTKDLRIDTYRAGGAGGQHVNKTDSAVRITHMPSGLVVACQDERSQHKNKARAMKVLQSRLFALEKEKSDSKMAAMRKDMVASADRAEKIRTYNYPQNRVTEHRSGLTLNKLEYIMQGDLEEIIKSLSDKKRLERQANPFFINFIF